MSDATTWKIEQHTLAKHELLRRYLAAWFPILTIGGHNRRVIYLDGFAGPGRYADDEPGSPLIALDTLVNHSHFSRMSDTEFIFAFVEQDAARFASLKSELERFWNRHGGTPSNVDVRSYNEPFEDVAQRITSAAHGRLAPTFAFVDPFGWSGVAMQTIGQLLGARKCEVLFNFMHDSINRFVSDTRTPTMRSLAELFGTDDFVHHRASALHGEERKSFLRDLYLEQLRTAGAFRFVRSFEIVDQRRKRTLSYLMYGTRHHRGLEAIKEAMWALDPAGGTRFSGFAGDQQVLFAPEPDLEPLRGALMQRFAGKTVSVEVVERFVIEETSYKSSHHKSALKELEEHSRIVCTSERKRRGTYPKGTVMRFSCDHDRANV